MAEEYKLKKMTATQLAAILRIGLMMLVAGSVLTVAGIAVGVFSNMDRYGGRGVTAVAVAAKVTGCESMFVEEEQDGASLQQERHYLVAEYQYKGETHSVQLPDYFVDKSYVRQYEGETRELYINAATFELLEKRPLNLWFLIPFLIGISGIVSGILYRFRYADYKERLMPKRRYRRKGGTRFVLQRGQGIK